jgi:hypothetical protein
MGSTSRVAELLDIPAPLESRGDGMAKLRTHLRACIGDHGAHLIEAVDEDADEAVPSPQDQGTRFLVLTLTPLPDVHMLATISALKRASTWCAKAR